MNIILLQPFCYSRSTLTFYLDQHSNDFSKFAQIYWENGQIQHYSAIWCNLVLPFSGLQDIDIFSLFLSCPLSFPLSHPVSRLLSLFLQFSFFLLLSLALFRSHSFDPLPPHSLIPVFLDPYFLPCFLFYFARSLLPHRLFSLLPRLLAFSLRTSSF